jgi:hypothetical protein
MISTLVLILAVNDVTIPARVCTPQPATQAVNMSTLLAPHSTLCVGMADGGGTQCTCTPNTCGNAGYSCGTGYSDGCGGTFGSCGTCTAFPNSYCAAGNCACSPFTCGAYGATCGTGCADDCGGVTASCGTCDTSGGHTNNTCSNVACGTCSCTASTCGSLGYTCSDGTGPDGCGATVAVCGTCPHAYECTGPYCYNWHCSVSSGGTCACTPDSCSTAVGGPFDCGSTNNGCGGATGNCGVCDAGSPYPNSYCAGFPAGGHCLCTPSTCGGLGFTCGGTDHDNGCGGRLGSCGDCTSYANSYCNEPGGPDQGGTCACAPNTCAGLGRLPACTGSYGSYGGHDCLCINHTSWDDGCGRIVYCDGYC